MSNNKYPTFDNYDSGNILLKFDMVVTLSHNNINLII
jgi:hypothetical protein